MSCNKIYFGEHYASILYCLMYQTYLPEYEMESCNYKEI